MQDKGLKTLMQQRKWKKRQLEQTSALQFTDETSRRTSQICMQLTALCNSVSSDWIRV